MPIGPLIAAGVVALLLIALVVALLKPQRLEHAIVRVLREHPEGLLTIFLEGKLGWPPEQRLKAALVHLQLEQRVRVVDVAPNWASEGEWQQRWFLVDEAAAP